MRIMLHKRAHAVHHSLTCCLGASGLLSWGLWYGSVGSSTHQAYFLQQTGITFNKYTAGYSQVCFLVASLLMLLAALVQGITWMDMKPLELELGACNKELFSGLVSPMIR